MPAELITTDDLREFRFQLLSDIQEILKKKKNEEPKKYLKSAQVRKMLGLSPNTLLNLRMNGTLPFSKIGGIVFFDRDDIIKMMKDHQGIWD
jgi:predicted DNA-binding transcriptional regulator AlpA